MLLLLIVAIVACTAASQAVSRSPANHLRLAERARTGLRVGAVVGTICGILICALFFDQELFSLLMVATVAGPLTGSIAGCVAGSVNGCLAAIADGDTSPPPAYEVKPTDDKEEG